MESVFNNMPAIIAEAAKSPWGLVALVLLLLAAVAIAAINGGVGRGSRSPLSTVSQVIAAVYLVALIFFARSPEPVKLAVFVLLLVAGAGLLGLQVYGLRREETPAPPSSGRIDWTVYKLFQIGDFRLAYIPLVGDWWKNRRVTTIRWSSLKIELEDERFCLPAAFGGTEIDSDYRDEPSCRLMGYRAGGRSRLTVRLQETSYGDYLRSGEHLDDPLPSDPRETFRSAVAGVAQTGGGEVSPKDLTNICGAGLFLVTRDNKVIASRHSDSSHVYPGRWTFSASGLMKWGAYPHPFTELARKTYLETHHQVNPSRTRLVAFGADARKLYFQFGFVEQTQETAVEIIERHKMAPDLSNEGLLRDRPHMLEPVTLAPESIADSLMDHCWEPSAEACILTLCAMRFGPKRVAQALHARKHDWPKREMRDEWDLRASQRGDLPDSSVRYPRDRLPEEKEHYVDAVLKFMGEDVRGKDVIEVGIGTGRITARLVELASALTCVDLCDRMIQRNRQRLGLKADQIRYIPDFMQQYKGTGHDVAVCSLVLVHNVRDQDFKDLVARLCESSSTVFVFEDTTEGRKTSGATRLRTQGEIEQAFNANRRRLAQSDSYELFEDRISFMKFVKEA